MRNLKKFLALVLAMLMVVSAAATVSAFEDVAEDNLFAEAIADLSVLDIVNGYDETNFGPEDAVTRQQFALMMARAITGVTDDAAWAQGGLVAFDDVTEYQYAIATVVKAGIVDGFLDNTFRPEEGVTFIQALKMAVCALGYGDGLEWWQGYYNVALDLGLTANLNQITDKDQALNRGEVAQIIYNMLYATAADGSTLYADNFEVIEEVVEPADLTVMAIVATNKQYATENINVAEGGFVGVQEIVAGVPSGDIYYLPIADFGFESDAAAERSFLDAFAFENWNDGDYDAVYTYGTEDVIYNTAITEAAKGANHLGKLTIDGKNYYMVEKLTGSAIRNEVVVYNGSETAYVYTDKVLALDEDGKFYDENGNLALAARFNSKGEIVAYYDYAAKAYVDEEQATAKYGIPVVSNYDTHLGVMGQADLAGAYQLTVYDDDMDGVMDRAYYTPVYVAAHETSLNDSKLRYGPMAAAGKKNTTFVDEDGNTVTLADAQVYKYTYNVQLNQVTVLGTYDVQTGTLQRVNTTADKSDKWVVKLTIDGEVYTLGTSKREGAGLDGFTIYDKNTSITEIANISGKTNAGSSFNSGYSALGYTYDNNFGPTTFKARDYVRFVAVDGVITIIESYDLEEAFDLVILDEVTDFDTEAIYMNLWFDGELVEDVAVTRLYDESTGKMVNVADLNYFKLSTLLSQVYTAKAGYAYRAVPTADGWQLSKAFKNDTTTDAKEIIVADAYVANDYKLAYLEAVAGKNTLVFDDGIGDTYSANIKDVLRTDKDTIFYFVKNNADVSVYVGQPQDGATIYNVDNGVEVYANKLGYATTTGATNNLKGVADVVVVYYDSNDDIKGFGLTGIGEKIVYITECTYAAGYAGKAGYLFDPYDNGTGADLGLSEEYWDGEFWFYNTNIAIDMHTGAAVNKIYAPYEMDIEQGAFYYLSDDNVVIGKVPASVIKTTNMNKADIVESRTTTIALDAGTITVDSYKFAGKAAELKAANIKGDKSLLADTDLVVKYIDDNEDKIFVGIVCAAPEVEEVPSTDAGTINALWTYDAGTTNRDAIATIDVSDKKINGETVVLYNSTSGLTKIADKNNLNAAAKDSPVNTPAIYGFTCQKNVLEAPKDVYKNNLKLEASFTAQGTLTFSVIDTNTNLPVELEAGNYVLDMRFNDSVDNVWVKVSFTIAD